MLDNSLGLFFGVHTYQHAQLCRLMRRLSDDAWTHNERLLMVGETNMAGNAEHPLLNGPNPHLIQHQY